MTKIITKEEIEEIKAAIKGWLENSLQNVGPGIARTMALIESHEALELEKAKAEYAAKQCRFAVALAREQIELLEKKLSEARAEIERRGS